MANFWDKFVDFFTGGNKPGVTEPSQAEVDAAKYRVATGDYHDSATAQIAEENPEMYAALQQQEFELSTMRETNQFNAGQAQLNRDWQTAANKLAMEHESREAELYRNWLDQQRSTSYQVAVEDAKKAGLNPILAASNGGAAVVSGAMGSGFSSSGSSASGVSASGSKASTDYTGSREFAQSLVSAAAQIGLGVLMKRSFFK